GALEQRVVDVGDVLRVDRLDAGVAPGALHDVEREVGERVAEVGRVVGGDAAHVEQRAPLGDGGVLEALGGGVEQLGREAGAGQLGQLGRGPSSHRIAPAVATSAAAATAVPPSA